MQDMEDGEDGFSSELPLFSIRSDGNGPDVFGVGPFNIHLVVAEYGFEVGVIEGIFAAALDDDG